MVDDRLEVAVGEATGLGGQAERPIDLVRSDERRKLGRPADLRPDPLGSRRRGEDEPALGSGAQLEERLLLGTCRLWPRMERISRSLRVVGGIDPGVAGRRQSVAGNLAGADGTNARHDEFLAVNPDPDPLADQFMGHRVPRRAVRIVDSSSTTLVRPKATVKGSSGTG